MEKVFVTIWLGAIVASIMCGSLLPVLLVSLPVVVIASLQGRYSYYPSASKPAST
jgi:hypothetical protein